MITQAARRQARHTEHVEVVHTLADHSQTQYRQPQPTPFLDAASKIQETNLRVRIRDIRKLSPIKTIVVLRRYGYRSILKLIEAEGVQSDAISPWKLRN